MRLSIQSQFTKYRQLRHSEAFLDGILDVLAEWVTFLWALIGNRVGNLGLIWTVD